MYNTYDFEIINKIQKASLGYQAQVWQDRGIFEIHNIKDNDLYIIENNLRNIDEIINFSHTSRYDFTKPFFGTAPQIHTIRGNFNIKDNIMEKVSADPTEAKRIQELSPDTYAILYGWRYKYQDPVEISPEEYDDDESLNIRLNQIMKDYNRYSMKDSKGNRYINKSDFKFYILYNKNKSTIYENLNLNEALSVLKNIE